MVWLMQEHQSVIKRVEKNPVALPVREPWTKPSTRVMESVERSNLEMFASREANSFKISS